MKKLPELLCCAAFIGMFASSTLHAAPPKDIRYLATKPTDFRPCHPLSGDELKALQAQGAIRKSGMRGILSPTKKKILVIRVQFVGSPALATTKAQAEAFFASLRQYYSENSYGLLTASATVTDSTYTLSSITFYNNETDTALRKLRDDVVSAATTDGIDFSQYDHVMIFHAGRGEEESFNTSDLWSLFYGSPFTASGKQFNGFTVVPESANPPSSPLGVVCHEYGHQLGLPDLYDTSISGGRSTVGTWSVMDYPYGVDNTGRYPPHLDPWSKNLLQFIDLSSRVATAAVPSAMMGDIETSQTTGFYKIPIEVGGSNEYFIAEYRNPLKCSFGESIPGSGILIWHIDDSIAADPTRFNNNDINTGTPHLGVDLVEADGRANYPAGKATDAFPQGNSTFASPLSNAFSGQTSGVTLTGITLNGDLTSFSITKLASSSQLSISKATNFPNPAGPSYPHPRAGILTTLVFQLSKPPQALKVGIFNLAGEEVRSLSKDQLTLKPDISTDYSWIYEFDWDGKNDSGEKVAPGLYFYRISADDKIKVGKLAVTR